MNSSLQPTFKGYVQNTKDALVLFQAVINDQLKPVSRRPNDQERRDLIQSGNIFIFDESASGIKRWTDGVSWSPSRILGNFLVYRELDKPFAPGEKKRTANKRGRKKRSISIDQTPYSRAGSASDGPSSNDMLDPTARYMPHPAPHHHQPQSGLGHPDYQPGEFSVKVEPDALSGPGGEGNGSSHEQVTKDDRELVGSLVDSYGFKDEGLIKKTMSITVPGPRNWHLISYYRPSDVKAGLLPFPSKSEMLKNIPLSEELTRKQHFRVPLDPQEGGPSEALQYHQQHYVPIHQPLLHQGSQYRHHQMMAPPHQMTSVGVGPFGYLSDQPHLPPQQHFEPSAYDVDASATGIGDFNSGMYRPTTSGSTSMQYSTYRPFSNASIPSAGLAQPSSLGPSYGMATGQHDYYNYGAMGQYTDSTAGAAASNGGIGHHPPPGNPQPTTHSPNLPPVSNMTNYYSTAYGGGGQQASIQHDYHAADPRRLPDSSGSESKSINTPPQPIQQTQTIGSVPEQQPPSSQGSLNAANPSGRYYYQPQYAQFE
ncbi:hypothetical protein TRVA0_033S00716 [Trichomonascus vanleenenianus]|uniref:Gti1/Pac2 family protein n=1 Tax=Trichomonascus vanleenenianus TaxID=2268995 RepID=UPI003ECAAF18